MEKEKIYSRVDLLLLAAGCTIGVGNIWRFPYLTVEYGGGIFLLVYFIFLVILGIPIMAMEIAIGRASRQTMSRAFQELDKESQHGHIECYVAYIGNFLLLAIYVPVTGWSIYYFFQTILGKFSERAVSTVSVFQNLTSSGSDLFLLGFIVIAFALACCWSGMKEGILRTVRVLIVLLFLFLSILVVGGLFQTDFKEVMLICFKPNWQKVEENGFFHLLEQAMNQALFTLGLGVGVMTLLGKHMTRRRTLIGEAVWMAVIDTLASIMMSIAVLSVCVSYQKKITAGPELVFQTLPRMFYQMSHGKAWGGVLYLVVFCAVATTTLILFENIAEMFMDQFRWNRKKACTVLAGVSSLVISVVFLCIIIFSSKISATDGTTALIIVDSLLRRWIFPAGTVLIIMGCTAEGMWGFRQFLKEVNQGEGIKLSEKRKPLIQMGLPALIIIIVIIGWMNL